MTRVLIADDVALNRELIRGFLEPKGYEIDEVDDGAKAVQAVRGEHYDIVLMDMQMPNMDGLAATLAIRALGPPYDDLPIIVISAGLSAEQVENGLKNGLTAHLSKPFTPEGLCAVVGQWSQPPALRSNPTLAGYMAKVGPVRTNRLIDLLLEQMDAFDRCNVGDRKALQSAAHALRGASAMLGFSPLSRACRDVEDACRMSADPSKALAEAAKASVAVRRDARTMHAA